MSKEKEKKDTVETVVEVKKEVKWADIFNTVIEKSGGETQLVTIQQNTVTKDIRVAGV